jgi:protein-L-isoaspartate(D-aspartate) O-methyltransferase
VIEIALRRRFYAEEIAAVANIRTPALVEALATVPRERFLRPGPWLVVGEGSVPTTPRQTADADPRHVYHNYAIGIVPERQLFNGSPALVCGMLDLLQLAPGHRVRHVGAGLGYYSSLIGHIVGPSGRVVADEVDDTLAAEARVNLGSMPWIDVRGGAAAGAEAGAFDAILVNTGVTHPQESWLDALVEGGRLIVPLTAGIAAMGPIGKGVMTLLTKRHADAFDARVLTFVAIYSAIGLRDEALNDQLGKALMRTPFPRLKRLRRDPHDRSSDCWLHGSGFCLSMD